MTGPSVNLAVAGKFHYFNYVGLLADAGLLNRFYYSHKLSSHAEFNLPPQSVNATAKEHLLQGSRRLFGQRYSHIIDPWFGALWAWEVMLRWSPADLLHVLAHGHALPLVHRAKRDGAKVIAEMVNTHHDNTRRVYERECEKWRIRPKPNNGTLTDRMDQEADAADLLLVPSEPVRQSFAERGYTNIAKLPYGANLSRFYAAPARAPEPGGPLRVVCVGGIGLRKGQLHLLEAVRQLGSKVRLTLVGVVDDEVRERIADYEGTFDYIKTIPNSELVGLLHANDVFVLPSNEEGMAVANCEALAAGLAVVTTYESGAGEIIRHGENGLLVEAGQSDSIRAALEQLWGDRDLAARLGQSAAQSVREVANWQHYAEGLIEIYRDLAPAARSA
ncbi:MAG: glycosyltransferase family 4 protein [Devosia sp.]